MVINGIALFNYKAKLRVKKMFTEVLSGLLQASRVKASIKLLLIRLKLSVEIMECQAVCSVGAVSG